MADMYTKTVKFYDELLAKRGEKRNTFFLFTLDIFPTSHDFCHLIFHPLIF